MDCIFCKIIAGEVPAQKTYEDENVLSFLDAHPKAPGHTLVVPKEHYRWFYDLPDDLSAALFVAAKKVARALKEEHCADYVRLSAVGVDVPHVHLHLLPQHLNTNETEV